ncbi:MAG: RnfABCDGE type electron transport complex subunit E [Firmicutes bacterium]|nr:RnfABCDGE type electron transport complex subunit E [Bacillota bacterium]
MKTILNGIIKENPVFVLLLGLCPALAVTTTIENAFMMGFCVLVVLFFSNLIVSIIKKLVPENVKIPVYILIIGTFVTIVELLLKKFIPGLYNSLSIYLPLIVVNCIVLGRALSVASKERVSRSLLDAIGVGLGYTLSLIVIASFREILGGGTITLIDGLSSLTGFKLILTLPISNLFPFSVLLTPAGAFLTLGLILGVINYVRRDKHESN